MRQKEKLGNHKGVGEWRALNTAGDAKRFIAWCIHSVRDQSVEPKTGYLMARMGYLLAKTIDITEIEAGLDALQGRLDEVEHARESQTATAH